MSNNSEKKEVEFKFVAAEDHKTVISNRVWGGLREGGLFELNFMLEKPALPNKITQEFDSKGSSKTITGSPSKFIRENKATVYLSVQTIISFHDWLSDRIEELKEHGIIDKKESS